MRALGVVMLLVLSLGGSWAATQDVAAGLHDAPELGPPWATLGDERIYPPWGWIAWSRLCESRAPTLLRRASAIATVAALAGMAAAALAAVSRRRSPASHAHGSSRWATTSELRKAGLLRGAGVVLCQTGDARFRTRIDGAGGTRTTAARLGALVRHDGPEHVFCFAPTRSGKGVGLVVPTLLTWPHSVLVYDIKKENWALTAGWRRQFSRTWRFEPTAIDSVRFNPLLEIRKGLSEVRDTQNVADILVDPTGDKDTKDHWQTTAHSLLVGTILHVLYAEADKTLAGVAAVLSDPTWPPPDSTEEQAHELPARAPNDWQVTVRGDAPPWPARAAPDAPASQAEPDRLGGLDRPATSSAQDTESRVPDNVWAGYFPDEPAQGVTSEDDEPDAVGAPERKDLPV